MEKEIKIQVPDGYEIDDKNSTFLCIRFKPKPGVRTWEDYKRRCGNINIGIIATSTITKKVTGSKITMPVLDKKFIKHLEAEIKIKLLMPYYGGEITIEEWRNPHISKYTIISDSFKISRSSTITSYSFLAFHTYEERNDFLKYNENIIKDYFMNNDLTV
jgi:hypothetical protein